jgi:hypothetical protein
MWNLPVRVGTIASGSAAVQASRAKNGEDRQFALDFDGSDRETNQT